MVDTTVSTIGPQKFWGTHGGKLPRQIIDTDEEISQGLAKRIHNYAKSRMEDAGVAIQDDWSPIVTTCDGDQSPSERTYCVEWVTSQDARIGIQGIFTKSGWPFMDHGTFFDF